MLRHVRTLAAALALSGFVMAPTQALAGSEIDNFDSRRVNPVVDIMLMRPLGVFFLAGSAMLYVPAAAITGVTRPSEMHVPYDLLLKKPFQFVFQDRLGQH